MVPAPKPSTSTIASLVDPVLDTTFEGFDSCVLPPPTHAIAVVLFNGKDNILSNFHPTPVVIQNITFPTAEHAYQCLKAQFYHDKLGQRRIFLAETAARAKLSAKWLQPTPAQEQQWHTIRVAALKYVLEHKNQQDEDFRNELLAGTWYIETTPDTFWACGLMKHQAQKADPTTFPGNNVMGRLLSTLAAHGTLKNPTLLP